MVDQKKLSARAQRHIQRLCLGNRRMSAASIAAEVEGVEGQPVSAQTIRRTLHQIGLHGCRPRRKPLLKMMHKKARKQFAEDKQTKEMDYWNLVLWSDETKINLFGSDGVKRVWRQPGEYYKDKCALPTVKHGGGSVMVWGCMSAAGTGELQFIEGTMNANMYCDILKQKLDRRAVFQHDNDPKHTSKMTTAFLKKLRVKVMDWPSMSPDLNPIEHLWGILKCKVEERKVSDIHQLLDVVMEEWKRTPVATCEALVHSMPKRVILRGQQIYTVIQAVHSLLYIVAKCHFFSVVTWKDIIKYLQKCEGVLTSVRYCIYIYIHNTGKNKQKYLMEYKHL